ncbi:MAG: SUMF1/EgtB/PvdO family nonheme iron enzyme [Planctomycetaceae bacterium]
MNGQNRTWPVGRLKPNDFGLFDTQGSAIEWLYDPYNDYPTDLNEAYADAPNTDAVTELSRRVLRGGSFTDLAL